MEMESKNKPEKEVRIIVNGSRKKRRRYQVGDPDFKPPDGGWGWLVVFACGFSNLSLFPMFQQFGLLFREKFEVLGITNSQTTTVINMNSAFNSGMGLLNGPLFRKFSYRQVAMFGALLVSSSLFITTFCNSFWTYLVFYSMCYGSGIGTTQSSNALALNTYFKDKRRIATGLSWTTTALGPIVWPYIITLLEDYYGMEGTLLIFSAFALHAFMCSLLLHPVEWHTDFREDDPESVALNNEPKLQNGKLSLSAKGSKSLLSSTYMLNEDDPKHTGYEITDPGTPMMVKANDGYYSQFGSRTSLASNKTSSRIHSGQNSALPSKRPSYANLSEAKKRNSFSNLTVEAKERKRERRISAHKKETIKEEAEDNETEKFLKVPDEQDLLQTAARKLEEYQEQEERRLEEEARGHKLTCLQKLVIFFDFDLFKDPIYVNLMLGITIANFAELNFSILTPMVLKEFNFGKYQTATFMSLLGAADILSRFFVPFVAGRIGWDNKTFFLVGVLSMAFGRIILVHTQTYIPSLISAAIIGSGKGLRTIFMALVIPSYVPLERLPAASGLQLATSGLLFVLLGPVVGWIRDYVQNYVITLHILNFCTYFTTVAWTIEHFISKRRKAAVENVNGTN